MVIPVRRRLRTKTPPAAAQRVPGMGAVRRRMRSKGPDPALRPQPRVPAGSGGVPGPGYPGGGNPPDDPGPPGSQDHPYHPPGLPLQPGGDPPDDGGDGDGSGGDSEEDDGEGPHDDGGGRGRRGRRQTPLTIKWAKPLPKLDLPPTTHLQKASKVKQIWELWSVNVALAMSTWNDVAVASSVKRVLSALAQIRHGRQTCIQEKVPLWAQGACHSHL